MCSQPGAMGVITLALVAGNDNNTRFNSNNNETYFYSGLHWCGQGGREGEGDVFTLASPFPSFPRCYKDTAIATIMYKFGC